MKAFNEQEKAALVEQCNSNIEIMEISLKNGSSDSINEIECDLQINRIALAALTAKSVALVDERPGSGGISRKQGFKTLEHGRELFTTPPAPAVPDGWRLVPVEPDVAMRLASKRYKASTKVTTGPGFYRAMLEAAPKSGGDY